MRSVKKPDMGSRSPFISVCAFILLSQAASMTDHAYGLVKDKVLATVDNEIITLSDYQRYRSATGAKDSREQVEEGLLKKMIEDRIVLLEAKRRGIEITEGEVDEMVKEFRTQNALSPEDLERDLSIDGMAMQDFRGLLKDRGAVLKLVGQDVDSKIIVTDKEIEEFYSTRRKDFLESPETVEVKAILLRVAEGATTTEITDVKRKALMIAAQAKSGESFDLLVGKYGDEELRAREGRLGEFTRGTLIPELDRRAFAMKEGETSDPIWVKEGAYILKVIKKKQETYKPIEKVRGVIRERLFDQKKEQVFNDWMNRLWEKVSVTIQ